MYTYEDLFEQRSVVGAKLEAAMKDRNLTKTQLCKESNVSRPTVDKLLAGNVQSKANFERHIRKILDYLQLTPDNLMGNRFIQHNHIRSIRNIMRQKIEDLASKTGYSVERLREIEAGEEATLTELRDIALVLQTGTRCIAGDGFFEPQFAILDDILSEDEAFGGCGFWGHIGIFLAGTEKPTWFPITWNVHNQIHRQIQHMKRIVVPCMNNKVLLLNLNNIRQIQLLDDACDPPESLTEDHESDCGDTPLVLYEALEDYLYEEWDAENEKDTMSEKFRQVMEYTAKEEGWNEDSVSELLTTVIWYRDGKKEYSSMDYHRGSALISEIETLYSYEDDEFSEDYFDYEEMDGPEVFINMNEVSMIELPLVQVEEAICNSMEMDSREDDLRTT